MKSIKVCEYSRSFHDDLILQDQDSGERSQDQLAEMNELLDCVIFNLSGGRPGFHDFFVFITTNIITFLQFMIFSSPELKAHR